MVDILILLNPDIADILCSFNRAPYALAKTFKHSGWQLATIQQFDYGNLSKQKTVRLHLPYK